MFENIRLLKLDPREYFDDILGLVATGLATNSFLNLLLTKWLPSLAMLFPFVKNVLPQNYDYFPLSIGYIKIALWLIAYLYVRKWLLLRVRPTLHKLTRGRFFGNSFSMRLDSFERDWEFQGNVKTSDEEVLISNTPSGCIIKNNFWDTRVWDDFSATLKVSFKNYYSLENDYRELPVTSRILHILLPKKVQFRQLLGIIFRAQNLDDHFMLGIMVVGNNLIFRPHVRVSGNLDIPLHNSPNSKYVFQRKNKEFTFKLLVKRDEVEVYLKQRRGWIKCYYWLLPSYYKANLHESQPETSISGVITRKIPFKNAPGLFGFRNYGNELAVVKEITIESIR